MANQVYDPETQDDSNLGASGLGPGHDRPAGKSSDPRSEFAAAGDPSDPRGGALSDLKSGLKNAEGSGLFNPDGDHMSNLDPEDLSESEAAAAEGFANGFDEQEEISRRQRAAAFAKRNRGKLVFGGAVGGSFTTALLVAMFSLIPLKIEHMVQNVEDRFTAPMNTAMSAMNRALLNEYITEYVVPNYKACGTTVDRHCKVRVVGGASNPAVNLYRVWAKDRFENQLYTKYGIEFKYDTGAKVWRVKGPGTSNKGDSIGKNGDRLDNVLNRQDRKAFRETVLADLEIDSKWKETYRRYQLGNYMGRIDGIKRCIFFCGTRDKVKVPIEDAKMSAKYILAERVLKPRSELTFIAVQCLLDPSCQPDHTTSENNQEPMSDVEREESAKLESLAADYGIDDIAKLKATHKELSERGFQKYLVEAVLEKVMGKTAAQKVSDSIPIIGWINLAAEIVNGAHDAGPKLKKLSYTLATASSIALFMQTQTYADEVHTGNVDAAQVGSMVDSFGPGVNDPNDPLVGGTASAEESPLYNEIMNSGPPTASKKYVCNDGKPPVDGKICSEEYQGMGSGAANAAHDFLELPGLNVLTTIAQVWRGTIGQVFDFANQVAGSVISLAMKPVVFSLDKGCDVPLVPLSLQPANHILPGYCNVKDLAEKNAPKIIEGVTNWLLPNPWGNIGGGRKFTLLASGAKAYGDAGCNQIGCQEVDDATAISIINQQRSDELYNFSREPFFARMFDTSSSYSLVSRLAIATPINIRGSAQNSFASLLSSPLSMFGTTLGSAVPYGKALAATSDPDPFNSGNKAFPSKDIPKHPSQYWDSHNCGDTSENGPIAKWQKEAADGPTNETTGMPVHRTTEPCLLITASVGAVGGTRDSSLLNKEDVDAVTGGGAANASGEIPSGSAQDLAKQIVDAGNLTDQDGRYMAQIKAIAKGDFKCNVNPTILQMLVGVTVNDDHKLVISSLNRKCTGVLTASGTGSYHYRDGGGHAVDVVSFDGAVVNGSSSATAKYLKDAAKYLPKNTGYGQVESCGSDFNVPEGSYPVTDTCDHQHIQVPVKQAK